MHIFDGPMAHITNDKVETNMFLIWVGPDANYHRILCLARQCQFDNINEHLIDSIVFGCKSKKVQDKLLQMPIRMMLEECLLMCRHYESLQWHINTVRPTGEFKAVDGLAR